MIIVTAPQEGRGINETGSVYKCNYTKQSCEALDLQAPENAVNSSIGLTLASQQSLEPRLLVCGPTVSYSCVTSAYFTGMCYLLDHKLHQVQQIPKTLQECPKAPTDIAVLFDGSDSISASDFIKMKTFLKDMIQLFKEKDVRFAVIQYSDGWELHFNFSMYITLQNVNHSLDNITQLKSGTRTTLAMEYVIDNVFTETNGNRPQASKVLVVVTDGENIGAKPTFAEVAKKANNKNITRYAIGVGNIFNTSNAGEELKNISSHPGNVLKVNSFEGLENIQQKLQNNIVAIEGSQELKNVTSFQTEMSQEGFSAILAPDATVLGAVGAYQWSGGIFEYQGDKHSVFINASSTYTNMTDSYLGYAVKWLKHDSATMYAVGAPRHLHIGKVVVFSRVKDGAGWQISKEISGDQIGSYFGAELCAVDLDGDTNTDLLLIGAPHYIRERHGGLVKVCHVLSQEAFSCDGELQGKAGDPFGRFGASITDIMDINGDNIADVVVGAPLENNHHGSIYLFHGQKDGINSEYSQHIKGAQISSTLKYFGQSVHGIMDLTDDNLTDIAVGALGRAVLLRSVPIIKISASLKFDPEEVLSTQFECSSLFSQQNVASTAKVCFNATMVTKNAVGGLPVNISFRLYLTRSAVFQAQQPEINKTISVDRTYICEDHEIYFKTCLKDSSSAVKLRMNFSLAAVASGITLKPVLHEKCQTNYSALLQFKQNCGEDNICTDYLRITFNFSGFSSVIIGRHTELNLTVNLQNDYEDSSYTVVHFFYPLGLSFRKVNVPEASRHIPISCVPSEQPDQNVKNVVCGVSTPRFPAGSKIIFSVAFGITAKSTWGEKLVITANVTSNNKDRILNESAYTNEIPIQHAVALILIRGEESTHYINFSAITPQTKAVEHIYVVENLQEVKNLPVTLTFSVAVALGSSQIWNITNVSNDKDASCKEIGEIHENCSNMEAQQKEQVILDFQNVVCKLFQCSIISLGQKEPHHFRIKGNVSSSLISQHVKDRKLFLASSALVEYNRTKYVSMFGQEGSPLSIEILTEVEIYEEVNNKLYAAGIIGGLVLLIAAILLLRKCGFFERHYKNKVSGQNEELSPENESPTTEIGNMTSDKTASGQE